MADFNWGQWKEEKDRQDADLRVTISALVAGLQNQQTLLDIKSAIVALRESILSLGDRLMAKIDDLLVEAGRATTVGDSVVALVQKLVDNAAGDPVKIQEALNLFKANTDKVEAAVLEHTPQE